MKKTLFIIISILVVGLIGLSGWSYLQSLKAPTENSEPVVREEAEEEGVQEAGDIYYSNTSADEIVIYEPKPGDVITSPLRVSGKARGNWYFEASAPVIVTNWDGLIIGTHYMQAKEDWMTTEFVPFEGIIEFEEPNYGDIGSVIFRNDNPSDLPENDKAVEVPIRFK